MKKIPYNPLVVVMNARDGHGSPGRVYETSKGRKFVHNVNHNALAFPSASQ